jgi:uncharacterized protein (AIM24 family)
MPQFQDAIAKDTESGDSFSLANRKLLKVELEAGSIQARRGAMVAYQGDVKFEHSGAGGMGRMMKKLVTGEGTPLMKVEGTGEVFLADSAQEVHLLKLDNDSITCNGKNLLAFDSGIDWDITRIQGGVSGALAGGLFNVSLKGNGWVALLSDGPPLMLDVAEAPTFADAQSAICWSSGVSSQLKTDVNFKTLTGRASGESIQLGFAGQGWLLVQPSEGRVLPTVG